MEPVTHFLTGACLGRSGFNRRTAYATLAMTLAAEAPDIDVVSSFWGPVTGFCHHRGITHTLIGAPFMALAVTGVVWAIAAIQKKLGRPPAQPVRWAWIWLLALIADLSHLLLDYTNNYGLRPFFPFNPHWYSWDIVFIFEPVLFAFLLLGLVVPSLLGLVEGEMRRRQPGVLRGRSWAIAALTGMGLLYALRNAEHVHALQLLAGESSVTRAAAEPVMANPFTWRAVEETPGTYRFATVHTLHDVVEPGDTIEKPPVTAAVVAAKGSYLGRVYGDWSSWPLVEDVGAVAPPGYPGPLPAGARSILFRDLRFTSQTLGGEGRDAALSGWVVLDGENRILEQWMSGREQR